MIFVVLKELKAKEDELLAKKFLRTSVSPWGAPYLLCEGRMSGGCNSWHSGLISYLGDWTDLIGATNEGVLPKIALDGYKLSSGMKLL